MAGELEPITSRLRDVDGKLEKLKESLKRPTHPAYPAEPANPIETQIAYLGTATFPSGYRDGAWHEFGGGGGVDWEDVGSDAVIDGGGP